MPVITMGEYVFRPRIFFIDSRTDGVEWQRTFSLEKKRRKVAMQKNTKKEKRHLIHLQVNRRDSDFKHVTLAKTKR